jgi:hypothetical protein
VQEGCVEMNNKNTVLKIAVSSQPVFEVGILIVALVLNPGLAN